MGLYGPTFHVTPWLLLSIYVLYSIVIYIYPVSCLVKIKLFQTFTSCGSICSTLHFATAGSCSIAAPAMRGFLFYDTSVDVLLFHTQNISSWRFLDILDSMSLLLSLLTWLILHESLLTDSLDVSHCWHDYWTWVTVDMIHWTWVNDMIHWTWVTVDMTHWSWVTVDVTHWKWDTVDMTRWFPHSFSVF